MADLFFYGTLRHIPLLEIVLGRTAGELTISNAIWQDHKVFWAQGQNFPVVEFASGAWATGILVSGLNRDGVSRLEYYETGFDYSLINTNVVVDGKERPAQVFVAKPGRWERGEAWSLGDWAAKWGKLQFIAAEEMMERYGHVVGEVMFDRRYAVGVRAAQQVRAATRSNRGNGQWCVDRDVVIHKRSRPYMNFFSLEELDLQFRHFDGSLSPKVNRAALRVGDAAVVLPYDPKRDCVLLVEQFRPASLIAGDRTPWLWEAPAGLIDAGEDPEDAARREAQEEAKVQISRLEPVTEAYSTTGSSTEYSYIYVGLADLSDAGTVAGVESEGEDIRSEVLGFEDFMKNVESGAYVNLHLVTAAYWLALNRERLRQS